MGGGCRTALRPSASTYAAETGISFVELPEKARRLRKGEAMCVVESGEGGLRWCSSRSAAPLLRSTPRLEDTPELINASAEKDGVDLQVDAGQRRNWTV